MKQSIIGIMYDFDHTLSTTDMQNYSFIPSLGLTKEEFWGKAKKFQEKNGVEKILSYMYVMILEAKAKGIKLTREFLQQCGKNIEFFPGVTTWFDRINAYGKAHNIKIEHYLVSSGTTEIIEGTKIYKKFTKVYGCEYYYENGVPVWPKLAINYTQKTQFFFRIAKGVKSPLDDEGVNKKRKKSTLRIPYSNIIYIGDGMTDIACMTLVNKNNGNSIAVYEKNSEAKAKVKEILTDGRVKFICKADYRDGSEIDKVIRLIIDSVALRSQIDKKRESQLKKK